MTNCIYLDSISRTKPSRTTIFKALGYFEEPVSPYLQDPREYYETFKELFGASGDDQFYFTNSGAEAISQIMHSVVQSVVRGQGKNHFVVRKIDEMAAMCAGLQNEACTLTLAEVGPSGYMTKENLIDAISPRTCLLSLSLASSLTGVIQPLDDIIEFAKSREILVHLDVTHCIGKIPINFHELGCDYLSFNGEQFHALAGSGGFFAKKNVPVYPLVYANFVNIAQLAAMTQAALEAKENEILYCTEVARLRKMLEDGCEKALFQNESRLPHISCCAFAGIKNEALLYSLYRKSVFASMCQGASDHIPNSLSHSALTFSLSKDTQESEIERALSIINDCTIRLRKISRALL